MQRKWHPYLISAIEMRVLWTEIKWIKCAPSRLDRDWVNKRGLDLSKEVLWVSAGWRTTELPAIKVGGLKKNLEPETPSLGRSADFFFKPPTLMAGISAALWPTKTYSTSLKRSTLTSFVDPVSAQASRNTFHVFHPCSKYPHFNSTYLVRGPVFFDSSVNIWLKM